MIAIRNTGENFICATVPRENDPAMSRGGKLIEDLCMGITLALGGE